MDADLQHDETLLPKMLELLLHRNAELVIGSRYAAGGEASGLSSARLSISRIATQWGRRLTGVAVHDPMSGFFMHCGGPPRCARDNAAEARRVASACAMEG
jgi:dolichol-phosphate mannosyltransferase